VITFNCNGLGNKGKRQKVFTYLRDKLKNGFVFLQETHSTEKFEKEWKTQWGGNTYISHDTSNSTGCAIAFSEIFL
jgi:exonuclease III